MNDFNDVEFARCDQRRFARLKRVQINVSPAIPITWPRKRLAGIRPENFVMDIDPGVILFDKHFDWICFLNRRFKDPVRILQSVKLLQQ